MRMDLRKPCKHCPFSVAETRIRFACMERAEEIAEGAYRHGFPCHKSAVFIEDEEGDTSGYYAHDAGQHCIGSVMMFLNEGYDAWPGIDNRELREATLDRLRPNLRLAWDSEAAFIEANRGRLDAQTIETRRAETEGLGAEHESPVAESDAPNATPGNQLEE